MKKKIKFGGLFLVIFVAFIATLILPNQLVEVNAEEDITFTNFTDGYLDLKLGETKSFTIEGDKYQLRGCSANGENAIKTNFNKDNNTCEVTGNTYGPLDFSVEYIYTTDEDQEYPNVMMRTVTALVDLDEYVTKVMDLVPNEFTEPLDLYSHKLRDKLPNGFNLLHDESTCRQTTSGKVCTLTVDYTYYGTVQKNIKKTKEITFIGKKVP